MLTYMLYVYSIWEETIKTPVDLFPGAGTGGQAREGGGEGGGVGGVGGGEEDSIVEGDGEWISYGVHPTLTLKNASTFTLKSTLYSTTLHSLVP
jgi:hypothetical protein